MFTSISSFFRLHKLAFLARSLNRFTACSNLCVATYVYYNFKFWVEYISVGGLLQLARLGLYTKQKIYHFVITHLPKIEYVFFPLYRIEKTVHSI